MGVRAPLTIGISIVFDMCVMEGKTGSEKHFSVSAAKEERQIPGELLVLNERQFLRVSSAAKAPAVGAEVEGPYTPNYLFAIAVLRGASARRKIRSGRTKARSLRSG